MAQNIVVVPDWVKESIFYQIFPDRFENGDTANDPPQTEQWGKLPKGNSFFGGDLQGIINRLGHLKRLGVNAIYLNPIFAATTNHKYNTTDYSIIDPAFGTNELFDKFIVQCRANDIKVVIDGVFNHVGTEHFAFKDVKEKGKDSPYASWFNIYSFPVSSPKTPNYECWWGYGSLPKLMVQNPEVKKYIFEVTKHWSDRVDGWRLDVPNEIPHEFWKEFRTVMKSRNPGCYIVGEIWDDASAWLQGDEFDGVMNYRFREACLDYFVYDKIQTEEFDKRLETIRSSYNRFHNLTMLNLLGSHDTERYLTLAQGEYWRMKLSVILQMTYVGAPMVYYGDEIGMEGGKDPDCRRTMIWDEKKWDNELFSLYQQMIRIRKKSIALRRGQFKTLVADNHRKVFAFERHLNAHFAYVAINRRDKLMSIELKVNPQIRELRDEFTDKVYTPVEGNVIIDIPGHTARIFVMTIDED
ncbi:MAG: glycoside hydrolase family 13 protein [Bacteroidota bacterium]